MIVANIVVTAGSTTVVVKVVESLQTVERNKDYTALLQYIRCNNIHNNAVAYQRRKWVIPSMRRSLFPRARLLTRVGTTA